MKRRVLIAGLVCAITTGLPAGLEAQQGNMSDATGATIGLFSRMLTRAFAAPPAPPPTLVISPEIMEAMCVERRDATLVYAALSKEADDQSARMAVALFRGGPDAPAAARWTRSALIEAGAGSAEVENLVTATTGLLTPERPEVPDVANAVFHFNELVASAPADFLAGPPPEFLALRHTLGRLTAAANTTFESERVYPDLPPAEVRYANEAPWHIEGLPIEVLDEVYLQFGNLVEVGNQRFHRVAEYKGVWVLSTDKDERDVEGGPSKVYVPLRGTCDIVLQPYLKTEPVIKRDKSVR